MITYPLILIGLVAMAIPVLVHLFNFRRYRKVYFSNVDQLMEVQQQTRKQSELMRWLVMVARMLAIGCLVVAFAQPVVPGSGLKMNPGGTAVSIYLDNSFSMENTNADGTLLEMGRTKVREIVAAYEADDQFQLLTNEADGSQFRWLNRDELLEELDKVEPCPYTTPMSHVGEQMYDFLRRSRAGNMHCYVVSDFQRTTADLQAWKSDTAMHTTFVVVEGTTMNNLSIDSMDLNAPVYYQGNTLEATVHLSNHGNEDLEQLQVKLYANGTQRAIATLDLAANAHGDATLKMAVDQKGPIQCWVEVTDYPITFDDKMHFSVNVNERINVAVIGKANEYLDRLFDGDSAIRYSKTNEKGIDYERLGDNNLIVLNEPEAVPSGLAQELQAWVESGGTLLVVPGVDLGADLNAALATWKAPLLDPWQEQRMMVSEVSYGDVLFRGVFAGKTDDIELPTLQGFHPMAAGPATVRNVVMTLADGGAFLTETPNGSGRVYVTAAPLDGKNTDWVRQALFVPTVYNMALYSKQMGMPCHTLGDEAPIRLGNTYTLPHLKMGNTDIVPETRQVLGKTTLLMHGQRLTAGNYTVEEGDTQEGISFNYDRSESDMATLATSEVESAIEDNRLEECGVVANASKSMEHYIRQQRDNKPLWQWFVAGALLMLLVEVVLIRYSRKGIAHVKS